MIYVKITMDKDLKDSSEKVKKKKSFLVRILSMFIPIANPDYEDKIDLVSDWLLEFETESSTPNREIGLSSQNKVLMKMPYKNNYGYWCDNNLIYKDFKKSFTTVVINKSLFDDKWKELDEI